MPTDARPPVFAFEDAGVRRGERWALRGVCADVPATGITALAGPSGSGKSSLLRLCNRLDVPDEGRVLFRGEDVATLDPLRLRRRIGLVSQRPVLFGGTIRDNLRVALPDAGDAELTDALARASLDASFLDRPGSQLSGGEAQRACLARTLVTEPEVLLLDEPTSALDAGPRQAFERLTRGLAEEGMSILWVTHDVDQLRRIADHVLVLSAGRLCRAGGARMLDDDREVAALLAGDTTNDGNDGSPGGTDGG
ncbi:MAG: ABC transporter ATP-binding protein [Actinomycetes bacterium]